MNRLRNNLLIKTRLCSIALLTALIAASANAQTPASAQANDSGSGATRASLFTPRFRLSFTNSGLGLIRNTGTRANIVSRSTATGLMPTAAAGPNLQVLGGGTVGMMTKWLGFNGSTATIGDSNIFEDKFGKVGIGTITPTSLLTVQGMIEITLGGLKFPDGSVQSSAPVTSVIHNTTLTGNGTTASPLGVAVPLNLTGTGTILRVETTGNGSRAIDVKGGNGATTFGGAGVVGRGGDSTGTFRGGGGVVGVGGSGGSASGGGRGVEGEGGPASGAGNKSGDGITGFPGQISNGATVGKAGRFLGDVEVLGTVSKAGGSFKIDHPLDPENKYLSHSFVESPDMMNIYNGNIFTDHAGEAIVELPEWFETLNRDFRYQLTVVGRFAQAIVGEEIKGNRFMIRTSEPGVKVSWQVTGVRQDAWANKNRIPVEENKSEIERGRYLHPEAFDQPEERSIVKRRR